MQDKRQKLLRIAEIDQSPKKAILKMYEVQEQDVEAIMAAIEAVQLEVEDAVANKIDGVDGRDGEDGYTPIKGVDYFDGLDGKDGKDGRDGVDGKDGYTPVKGVDYFDGVDGEKGEQGEKGEKGDMPAHQIEGHFIRFEKPDGEWGDWIKVGSEASNIVRGTLSQLKIKQSGTVVGNQVKEINFVGATVTGNKDSVTVTIDPGSSSLEDLTDVNITSPINGDILQYDSDSGEWINLLTATAQAEATVYVNAFVTVTGTRNGSERYPYATIQDAIDHFGIPSTQAEYELVKTIVIQDGTNYTENLLFPTGLWYVRFNQASLTGTIDWEIDSAERQGSSTAPRLFLLKDEADISVGITGDIEAYLKSGGSAVSTSYFGVYGMIVNGNITLSDGTNIGASYSSLPIVSFKEATIASAYNFKNRLCFLSLTNSNLASSGVSLEMGTLFGARNSTINATSVLEARSSTNSKNIVGLRLNSSGGVTWDSTGSVRNWNADPITATEVIEKITSFPSNAINLTKVIAESIGYDNTTSGLTAEDVQAAIDELDTNLGDYLPLAGGTLTGDTTLDVGVQFLGDATSSSSPTYSFDGYPDTGMTRQTISSANRVVFVADGVNTVEYGATGALTRVPFLFSRQDVAWGASIVDGGIKNVYESAIGEDVTRMWPNRDFNAIVLCDFGDRNRDTFNNVWTNDDQPGFLLWGSQTPNAANYHKYMFIGTDHDQGFSRIVTGTGWDLHMQVGNTVFEGNIDMDGNDIEVGDGDINNANVVQMNNQRAGLDIVNTATFTIKPSTKMVVSVQYTNTGTCAITLPAIDGSVDEYMWYIKDDDQNASTNNITISPTGTDTIEGASSYVMDSDGQSTLVYCDRNLANWIVL